MPPKNSKPTKAHNKVVSKIFTEPYRHLQITDFLSPDQHAQLFEIYNKLEFKTKTSDLFHFFQTNELNNYKPLEFFRQQLDKQFWNLQPLKSGKIKKSDTFYSIFASYYFKGDYLLCHDDVIEDRLFAFSYYLEDHPTGDLVLFNKDANKEAKRIKVKKNTLAIFQVSDISYHEVDYTETDGRKAITGWFNVKGLSKDRVEKVIPSFVPTIPKDVVEYPLQPEHISQEYFQLMDIGFQFIVKKKTLEGPFYQRKVHRLQLDPSVVFTLPGYTLYSSSFYSFEKGDYILLNDPVNTIEAKKDSIIDIFVTHLPEGFEVNEQEEDTDMLVKIAQPNQETEGIPQIHDSLFVVHRGQKQYYVDRCEKQFMLAHHIYIKDEVKKSSKKQTVKSPVKEQRTKTKTISKKVKETKQENKSKKIQKVRK